MSTGDTILAMTPIEPGLYWRCQRPSCKHKWPCSNPNKPPRRCAKCKRQDWNRETKSVGRPRNDEKPLKGKRPRKKKGKRA